ncbi:MAG: DNA-binding protein [Bacteroidetes bacterium 4484_276]|nr:MAG: DNA-binding protein [Bacteroidetes bacterium 4484_276]
MNNNIIIYKNGEIDLNISVKEDTIWLKQDEIAQLFGKDRTVITRHINNILKDEEVDRESNVHFLHIANSDKPVKIYSLDIVLAVGYRTNSAKAIKFRQWASEVMKSYITNGYVINSERITHQRFKDLENEVGYLKSAVGNISNALEDKSIKPKQDIFFKGQIFDAYTFVSDLVRTANTSLILIDNYIDDTVLTHFAKRKKDVSFTIFTKTISKQLSLDIKKHNGQYPIIKVKVFKDAHDRFLIIDEKEIYHFGASLKDLGKKWFAFSKMDISSVKVLDKLRVGGLI